VADEEEATPKPKSSLKKPPPKKAAPVEDADEGQWSHCLLGDQSSVIYVPIIRPNPISSRKPNLILNSCAGLITTDDGPPARPLPKRPATAAAPAAKKPAAAASAKPAGEDSCAVV